MRTKLVFNADAAVAAWVGARIPTVGYDGFGPCSAIGIIRKNYTPVAGIVYHDYQKEHRTIQISMAADSPFWATRANILALLSYPFEQLDCFKVFTITPDENEIALRVNVHIGFETEAVLAHQFGPDRHAVFCSMIKPQFDRIKDCKKWEKRHRPFLRPPIQ
ncbi:MAG: hypothetical protein H7829_17085 [Magnetococcus sp. THC-1_WYH]